MWKLFLRGWGLGDRGSPITVKHCFAHRTSEGFGSRMGFGGQRDRDGRPRSDPFFVHAIGGGHQARDLATEVAGAPGTHASAAHFPAESRLTLAGGRRQERSKEWIIPLPLIEFEGKRIQRRINIVVERWIIPLPLIDFGGKRIQTRINIVVERWIIPQKCLKKGCSVENETPQTRVQVESEPELVSSDPLTIDPPWHPPINHLTSGGRPGALGNPSAFIGFGVGQGRTGPAGRSPGQVHGRSARERIFFSIKRELIIVDTQQIHSDSLTWKWKVVP